MVFASPFIVESSRELVFWMETVLRFYFLTAISFAIAVLQSTAGGELFKYCNSRLHNGVCNCTTDYFALLSLTEHC